MKIQFISNACAIFESDAGTRIITDPWLDDGVFEGSWCHFHKLETTWKDIQDVDAIYLSHVHPDHYDARFFEFRKDIPIIILDHKYNFIHKNLESMGYTNLIKVKNNETVEVEKFKVTLFSPFVTNNYFEKESIVGNLIDSAIVIEADSMVAFNANDNNPDPKASKMLKSKFGKIDLAMMNYNAAGPYPSCFNNLTTDQKIEEHHKNLARNIDYLGENLEAMNPSYFLPFAGAYVLGGKLHHKNEYLGTTTWDHCASELRSKDSFDTEIICLNEKDVFDINLGVSDKPYVQVDMGEVNRYIKEELSLLKYPYEDDIQPDLSLLEEDIILASERMLQRCERINLVPDMNVYISLKENKIKLTSAKESKGDLFCSLDSRLLRRILDRSSHWNNAEIGCHVEFKRSPNYYSPDIHTMLQFLHL